MSRSFIVDAHLDLAYNALRGRDVLRPAAEQDAAPGEELPTIGLPDLRRGGVGLICATVFCMPAREDRDGYRTAEEAHAVARAQLAWYHAHAMQGHLHFVRSASDLPVADEALSETPAPQPAILLLEGADALRTPDDVPAFVKAGVRIVGLAWGRTRFAGGTDAPGPLTPAGVELIPHLDSAAVIHDASHLADESFWQLLDLTAGPVMASHSNCRAFVPTDRQLSDKMIRAIVTRGGVIGINLYDRFLLPPEEYGRRRATLTDVVRHVDHICQLAGNAKHVALGTDLDGGVGRYEIPEELTTAADLPKVGGALRRAEYDSAAVANILGRNWLRFFERALPNDPGSPSSRAPRDDPPAQRAVSAANGGG
jgi:membrane dipeptidase